MSALRKPVSSPQAPYHRVHTAVVAGSVRRVKYCPGCDKEKIAEDGAPDSGFSITSRYNGRAYFYPRCKECRSLLRRERRKSDPEWVEHERERMRIATQRWLEKPGNREKARKACRNSYYRRRAADPEAINESARMAYVLRQMKKGKTVRSLRPTVIDGTAPRLLAEPFREWLWAYRSAIGRGSTGLSEELGLDERLVCRILAGEQNYVTVDVVDRALVQARRVVRAGSKMVVRMDDLYPLEEKERRGK